MREFIGSNKLMFYVERLETKKPITLEIFLTDYCDNGCPYCQYRHGKQFMSFGLFREVLERALKLGIKGVILTGGGEPMLDPDFDKIVAHLDELGVPYGVNTYLPRRFPKASPRWLKVSYHNDRVLDKYAEYLEDVPGDTFVSIQLIYLKAGDLMKFYQKVKDIERFQSIVVRPLEHQKFKYSEEVLMALDNEHEMIDDDRIVFNYKWNFLGKRFKSCYANWAVLTVMPNADVVYCCHKPDEVIGSIFDDDILMKKMEHKTNMLTCDVPCRLSGANKFLKEDIKQLPMHLEFI